MRKNVFSMIAFAMMMLLSGCDKLNEATSRDFKAIVIPAYTIGGAFTAPADMNAFTAAFILKLLDVRSNRVQAVIACPFSRINYQTANQNVDRVRHCMPAVRNEAESI